MTEWWNLISLPLHNVRKYVVREHSDRSNEL